MIALIASAGFISSFCLGIIHSRRLLMVVYHLPFRFWRPYLPLYDELGTRNTYELLDGPNRFGGHSAFMRYYAVLRPQATSRFEALWDASVRHAGRDYIIVLVMSIALFWAQYGAFIGPFLIVQLVAMGYLRIVKRRGIDFFSMLVLGILLAR